MRLLPRLFALAALALPAAALGTDSLPDGLYAEFTTPRGTFVAELFADKAPLTVTNFVALAEGAYARNADGTPHFTGLTWSRVVPGFVIQAGKGVAAEIFPYYPFPDEFVPGLRHDQAGILSMANGGPDTNNAVFFITLDDATRLNYMHSVFGRVVRGRETLSLIRRDDDVVIRILRIGASARSFPADETAFRRLAEQGIHYEGERAIGAQSHFDDPDALLPTDVPRALNFTYKLANYERFTGLKVCARVFALFKPGTPGQTPSEFTQTLAQKLGLAEEGVLAVYFADTDKWEFAVGTARQATFQGAVASLSDRIVALREDTGRIARNYATQMIAIRGKDDLTPADHLKYEVDAVLDSLLVVLEPDRKSAR